MFGIASNDNFCCLGRFKMSFFTFFKFLPNYFSINLVRSIHYFVCESLLNTTGMNLQERK